MAAVSVAAPRARAGWNPLALRGAELEPRVLLAAKIVALVFLVGGAWSELPEAYLPFVGVLDDVGAKELVRHVLEAVAVVAAAAILFNRRVQVACVVLGGAIVLGILSSRPYFENNRTFAALLLLLIGLSTPRTAPLLIRAQLVILYAGAGLNKLLDADWRSGRFFDYWNGVEGYGHAYQKIASLLPGMTFSAALSWAVILTELLLAVAFAYRRLVPLGIVLVPVYHSGLLFAADRTFGFFWFATAAAGLALLTWPRDLPSVRLGDGGAMSRLGDFLRRADLARAYRWRHEAGSSVQVEVGGARYTGAEAIARLLLYNPTAYLGFAALVALPLPDHRWAAVVVFAVGTYALVELVRRRRLRDRASEPIGG